MSVANNHIIDGGHEGLRQTLNLLHSQGIRTVGAASNLAEALKPAVLTTAGPRIAVIAVSSVFPMGYEARIGVPGLAPLRAHTFYLNPTPDEWNPGVLPQVVTAIDDDDSEAIEQAIAEAREVADLVIVSVHWGDVTGRHRLTPHEPQAAELFVQAGADLVLGHHQHTVRGVGFIGRTPIFYGLGHLACDLPRLAEDLARETTELWYADEAAGLNALGSYGIFPRQGYPLLPFHPDARFTVVARCDLDQNGVAEVGMYPCRIEPDGDVIPLAADEDEYLEYLVAGLAAVPDAAEVRPGNDGKWAYWQLLPRS
jgi:poly-gamma-glutamate synthesis protein (capsule biosynthesis protein)